MPTLHILTCACVQEAGMVLKKEDYTVRVPRSQRGGEIVEPLLREQWFVRMQPLAEPALQVTSANRVTPAHSPPPPQLIPVLGLGRHWSIQGLP